jgi:transposase-like protein
MLNALAASLASSQSVISSVSSQTIKPVEPVEIAVEPRCSTCQSQDLWKPIGSQDQSWRCMACEKPPSQSFVRERFKPVKLDASGQPISEASISGSNVDLSPWIVAMGEPVCLTCKSAWIEVNPIRETPYRCGNCRDEISSELVEDFFFNRNEKKPDDSKTSRQKFFTR